MRKLYRNEADGMAFGVCQGLGELFDVDPILFRIAFVLIPKALIVYIVLAICTEEKPHEES